MNSIFVNKFNFFSICHTCTHLNLISYCAIVNTSVVSYVIVGYCLEYVMVG